MREQPEWAFTEPPGEVNIERLWIDMIALPSVIFRAYLLRLEKEAPKTFSRLKMWRQGGECKFVNWDAYG